MPQQGRGAAKRLTPEKREQFLEALRRGLSVGGAASAIGFSRETVYRHASKDREFSKAWDDAQERGTDLLEDVATSRAVNEKDTTLLIFLLKARRPDKYRDRYDVTSNGQSMVDVFSRAMSAVQAESVKRHASGTSKT